MTVCPCCGNGVNAQDPSDLAEVRGIRGQQKILFDTLVRRGGRHVSYRDLSEEIWPEIDLLPDDFMNPIRQIVHHLRPRLFETPYAVETVYGTGFILKIRKDGK